MFIQTGFRLVDELGYLAVALPKFNIMAIYKLFAFSMASVSSSHSRGTEL